MTHMQSELDELRKSNEEYRKRLRDMELDNDELEGKERCVLVLRSRPLSCIVLNAARGETGW